VTPVYKLSASSVTGRTNYGSMLAGNPAYVLPTDFESIATVTVGSGGSSSISFSSLPATYKHLQLRYMARSNRGIVTDAPIFRFNGNSTSSNYAMHSLDGDGASATAFAETSAAPNNFGGMRFNTITAASASASIFGVGILDIFDYNSTDKKKTIRSLGGNDRNGSGTVELFSGFYLANNDALTSFTITPYGGSLIVEYSHFALYGIKGA
jgi:hypothetical protein